MKGLSPIVAVVLLIAFVVAVGGILSVWLSGIAEDQTQTVSADSEAVAKCVSNSIVVDSVRYQTSGSDLVNVTFTSDGSEAIKNITITIVGGGAVTNSIKYFNGTTDELSPGLVYSASVDTAGGAILPPEVVSVTGLCQRAVSITGTCDQGESCMKPA